MDVEKVLKETREELAKTREELAGTRGKLNGTKDNLARIVKIVEESTPMKITGSDEANERDVLAFDKIFKLLCDEGLLK